MKGVVDAEFENCYVLKKLQKCRGILIGCSIFVHFHALFSGNLVVRLRVIDEHGGFTDQFETVKVAAPKEINLGKVEDELQSFADQQNNGKIVNLGVNYAKTITNGASVTEEQKKTQQKIVDKVYIRVHVKGRMNSCLWKVPNNENHNI